MFFIIGLVFSPIGGLMVFLITYEEFRHHYRNWHEAFRFALKDGLIAFGVLIVVTIVIGFAVGRMF
jgi:hypothetical protein